MVSQKAAQSMKLWMSTCESSIQAPRPSKAFVRKSRRHHAGLSLHAVVLVLGYYRCEDLCGLVMHGVLEALAATGLPPGSYRVLAVSIAAEETPADAAALERVYRGYAASLSDFAVDTGAGRESRHNTAAPDLHLLVGKADAIAALTKTVGYVYERQANPQPSAAQ